jgi:hypothetical protein
MSVDHSYVIARDTVSEVKVNISGLNVGDRGVDELSAHLYATCTKSGNPKFTCSLTVEQLAGLLALA